MCPPKLVSSSSKLRARRQIPAPAPLGSPAESLPGGFGPWDLEGPEGEATCPSPGRAWLARGRPPMAFGDVGSEALGAPGTPPGAVQAGAHGEPGWGVCVRARWLSAPRFCRNARLLLWVCKTGGKRPLQTRRAAKSLREAGGREGHRGCVAEPQGVARGPPRLATRRGRFLKPRRRGCPPSRGSPRPRGAGRPCALGAPRGAGLGLELDLGVARGRARRGGAGRCRVQAAPPRGRSLLAFLPLGSAPPLLLLPRASAAMFNRAVSRLSRKRPPSGKRLRAPARAGVGTPRVEGSAEPRGPGHWRAPGILPLRARALGRGCPDGSPRRPQLRSPTGPAAWDGASPRRKLGGNGEPRRFSLQRWSGRKTKRPSNFGDGVGWRFCKQNVSPAYAPLSRGWPSALGWAAGCTPGSAPLD